MPEPVNKPITTSPNTQYQPYKPHAQAGGGDLTPFHGLPSGPLDLSTGKFDPGANWSGDHGKADTRPGLGVHQSKAVFQQT